MTEYEKKRSAIDRFTKRIITHHKRINKPISEEQARYIALQCEKRNSRSKNA